MKTMTEQRIKELQFSIANSHLDLGQCENEILQALDIIQSQKKAVLLAINQFKAIESDSELPNSQQALAAIKADAQLGLQALKQTEAE